MPLADIAQEDFSAGAFPSVARELVPQNGFTDGINALISDDGLPFRRGGSVIKSDVNFTTSARFMWDGYLAPGLRTLIASSTKFGVLNPADDATMIDLANGGISTPRKAASLDGLLFLPGGKVYGGATTQASGSIGNVGVTLGSAIVTGTGFTDAAGTDPKAGHLFTVDGGAHYYAIKSVDSNTQLTLAIAFQGATNASIAASVSPFGTLTAKIADIYLAISDKLLAVVDDKVFESTGGTTQDFVSDEFHQLPGGIRGLGAEAVRDVAVIFTTAGVWAISGTAFDLTDPDGNPQQRLEQITRDLILWSWAGIATWGNHLVVPAVDGVWLMDTVSAPERVSTGMGELYRSYVDAGHHTGFGTVEENTYYLPIFDASHNWVDTFSCRLTPTRRGTAFGWTRHDGHGAKMIGFTQRAADATAREPYLLGVHSSTGRVCRLPFSTPSAAYASDGDGTNHVFELVTREYSIGNLAKNTVRRLLAYYQLIAASGSPTLTADFTEGDDAYEALTGAKGPKAAGDDPATWHVNKSRYSIRFRLRSSGAISKLVIHVLRLKARESAR